MSRLVETGRQKTLKLNVGDKGWTAISLSYQRLQCWLSSIAPQLDPQQTYERYLCWLNPLDPDDWPPKNAP